MPLTNQPATITNPSTAPQRALWMDLLRIAAITCVILLHVSAGGIYAVPLLSRRWDILLTYNAAARFCVPIFIMISGALFLQPQREITQSYLFRHILRLLIALIVWEILYAAFYITDEFLKTGVLSFDAASLSSGRFGALGQYHLIFLYYMIGLYIIVPVLRPICTQRKTLLYFLILSMLTASIFPALTLIPAFRAHIDPIIQAAGVNIAAGMVLYFAGGYLLATESIHRTVRYILYAFAIVGFIATVAGVWLRSQDSGMLDEAFLMYLRPNIVAYSVGVFVFFRYAVSRWQVSDRLARRITTLAKCAFGMYLCHDFVLVICNRLFAFPGTPLLTVPAMTILVFTISFLISYCLHKIPVISKYII